MIDNLEALDRRQGSTDTQLAVLNTKLDAVVEAVKGQQLSQSTLHATQAQICTSLAVISTKLDAIKAESKVKTDEIDLKIDTHIAQYDEEKKNLYKLLAVIIILQVVEIVFLADKMYPFLKLFTG